jgi:hypothetical protein
MRPRDLDNAPMGSPAERRPERRMECGIICCVCAIYRSPSISKNNITLTVVVVVRVLSHRMPRIFTLPPTSLHRGGRKCNPALISTDAFGNNRGSLSVGGPTEVVVVVVIRRHHSSKWGTFLEWDLWRCEQRALPYGPMSCVKDGLRAKPCRPVKEWRRHVKECNAE